MCHHNLLNGEELTFESTTIHVFPAPFAYSRSEKEALEMKGGAESDFEREDDDERKEILKDRFRLSLISIAESEAKKYGMEISAPVMTCISDLTFKFTEQLAKDLELFARHANRKSVNVEDVILSAHRNEHVATSLRSFADEMKGKEPQNDKKRKKSSKKKETVIPDQVDIS
ncbi:protein MHF1 homolog [Magnolia sinica]|uniref:protein MHF1 homolog n=1 Tax=Magnolia sinica TaxID=86752 RepID=UPI00265A3353|nr:protein MHF1 homolog [Magnolia sinica]